MTPHMVSGLKLQKLAEICPSRYSLPEFRVVHIPGGKSRANFHVLMLLWISFTKGQIKNKMYTKVAGHLSKRLPSLVMSVPTTASQAALKQCLVQTSAWSQSTVLVSNGVSLGVKVQGHRISGKHSSGPLNFSICTCFHCTFLITVSLLVPSFHVNCIVNFL